jgi:hypothetical protein
MPPETPEVTPETPTASTTPGNSPEARTPAGELKDGLSPVKEALATEPTKNGETKSTPTSNEGKSLINQDGEAPKEEAKKAEGPPEKYEFKDLPEGFEVPEAAQERFKKNGLTQEQANDMVQFHKELLEEAQKAPFSVWKEMNDGWVADVQKDPEYKGNLTNVRANISKFIDGIGDAGLAESFREAMDLTGAGNNPAFVKFMFRMAQQFNEGTHVAGNGPSRFGQLAPGSTDRPTPARALYPNLS